MVWGCITENHKLWLVVIPGNLNVVNNVLNAVVLPFIHNQQRHMIFQHDNATPHTARITGHFWPTTKSMSCNRRLYLQICRPSNTSGTKLLGASIIILYSHRTYKSWKQHYFRRRITSPSKPFPI